MLTWLVILKQCISESSVTDPDPLESVSFRPPGTGKKNLQTHGGFIMNLTKSLEYQMPKKKKILLFNAQKVIGSQIAKQIIL